MDKEVNFQKFTGEPARVLALNDENGSIHLVYQSGKVTHATILNGNLPSVGDVILLGQDQWQIAPDEIWIKKTYYGTIRKVLSDSEYLIDDGLSIKTVKCYLSDKIAINSTIEFDEFDEITRVIADKPIRSREYGLDADQVAQEYRINITGTGPTFDDFGGYPEVVKRARELIETQFENREYLEKIGARPLKGILFSGPPGTGKTHLARIIAHSTKADFYVVSGPSIVSKWLGDTEQTLREIFDAAIKSKSGRAIIFFDEIDSIAERRTGETHEASKRLVAQLLTLMDGFDDGGKSVVVIAATNRVETLDPALMRPGRFDWEIEFGIPTLADRIEILTVGARDLRTSDTLPIREIAAAAESWSAAQLTALWGEAALIAAAEARDKISPEDFVQAFERLAKRPQRNLKEVASI